MSQFVYIFTVNWSMVVIIESAPDNFLRRQAIRETWASSKARSIVNILAVFILGTMDNKTTQQALIEENKQYGDILQMDKEDIYRSLRIGIFHLICGFYFCSIYIMELAIPSTTPHL